MIEETPVAMRRRLLLERAAWQLSRTHLSVTDVSLNANYQSLEAFSRAFRKAFRVSPSLYRRIGATYTHLRATNGIHHHSGKDDTKGAGQSMDLFDIFSGQESWHTRRLLDLAKTLNDEPLDRPLKNPVKVVPWDGPDQSLRQILDRMVQTKEAWAAALTGGSWSPMDDTPPPTELLRPCWHASIERTRSSTKYSQRCAIEALGTTHLSMHCANRWRPSPSAVCSLT